MNLLIVELEDGGIDDGDSAIEMDVEWSINLPIAIDESYNLIVCKGCGVAIPFDWIVSHLQELHGTKTDFVEVMRFLNMMRPSMTSTEARDWITGIWVARAVQNIAVTDGYGCNICQYSGRKMKAMRNHFTNAHGGMKASKNVTRCKVQLLFNGRLKKYIQIEEDEGMEMDVDGDSDWRKALELEFEEIAGNNGPGSNAHDDLRLMDIFIAKTRWDLCVKGMDIEELVRLVATPKKNDALHKIILCGRRYIGKCCNKINGGNMMVRRLIMTTGYLWMCKCYSDKQRRRRKQVF